MVIAALGPVAIFRLHGCTLSACIDIRSCVFSRSADFIDWKREGLPLSCE